MSPSAPPSPAQILTASRQSFGSVSSVRVSYNLPVTGLHLVAVSDLSCNKGANVTLAFGADTAHVIDTPQGRFFSANLGFYELALQQSGTTVTDAERSALKLLNGRWLKLSPSSALVKAFPPQLFSCSAIAANLDPGTATVTRLPNAIWENGQVAIRLTSPSLGVLLLQEAAPNLPLRAIAPGGTAKGVAEFSRYDVPVHLAPPPSYLAVPGL